VPTVPSSLPPSDSADPGLVRRTLEREEIRYLVVAGTTTLLYLSLVAGLLYLRLPYMVAILIAQVVIIGIAFPTYRRLIFRSTGPWRPDLPRFVGVWAGGFLAGLVATPALVEFAGMDPLAAQVLAVAAVAVLSYLGHKFLSFGSRR
jgi:putative flippase GtrA